MRNDGWRQWKWGLIALAGLLVAGCEQQPATQPGGATATKPAPQADADDMAAVREFVKEGEREASPPAAGLPAGHPPIGEMGGANVPPPPAIPAEVTLHYDAPEGWQRQTPRGSMRKDQYALPGAGEGDAAELAVFYLGSSAGSIEMNIDRWRLQFKTPAGEPVPEAAMTREKLEVNGLPVTVVEVGGTYSAGMMAGGGAAAQADQRMIAAIVETPAGPWFFKATGPDATIQSQRDAFMELVNSMRVE
jgi:hypothetical protein